MRHFPPPLGQVPASVMPVAQPSGAGSGLQRQGPDAPPHLEQQEPPQALSAREGPYVVTKVLRSGTYKLKTIDSEVFVNAWNIEQQRTYEN